MICAACTAAEANPLHGIYHATCLECAARMLAHGPAYWRSQRAQKQEPEYREQLARSFGVDDLAAWNLRVKEWAARIHQAKQWADIRGESQP